MALIRCPECGEKVSDKAPTCIHCGYPLQGKTSKGEKNNSSGVFFGILMLLSGLIGILHGFEII